MSFGITGLNVGIGIAGLGRMTTQPLAINAISNLMQPTISNGFASISANINTVASRATQIQTNPLLLPIQTTIVIPQSNIFSAASVVTAVSGLSPALQNLSNISSRIEVNSVNIQRALIRRGSVYSQDTLSISNTTIKNNAFSILEQDGISSFRPEILSIFDFKPVYTSNLNKNTVGEFLDVIYQTRKLREETILNVLKLIQSNTNLRNELNALQQGINNNTSNIKVLIDFFAKIIDEINILKRSLDIKDISPSSFNTIYYSTLIDFFERRLQFSKTSFSIFSETKIMLQFLNDFRMFAENYSYSLLNVFDSDRINDVSPVSIDKTFSLGNNFSFSISNLRASGNYKSACEESFFIAFLNSLPPDIDDKIKLLSVILSKELRVSKGLSNTDITRKLNDNFGSGNTGSPFDNIFGIPGNNIFTKPNGPQSISSLLYIDIDTNSIVLPFENKYIDLNQTTTTFVPGNNYFVDTILSTVNNNFNVQPFLNYINSFIKKSSDVREVIESLFDLNNQESSLQPIGITKRFLLGIKNSISGLMGSGTNNDQAIVAAIIKLSNIDRQLKLMLFQFMLLLGLSSLQRRDQKPIYQRLANELSTIHKFSFLNLPIEEEADLLGGYSTLFPYLRQLAQSIEDKIFTIVNGNVSISAGSVLLNLLPSNPNQTPSPTNSTIEIRRNTISSILVNIIDSNLLSFTNLFKEFVDIATFIDTETTIRGSNYVLNDDTGRTKYNFLTPSTLLLFIFEILSNYTSKYISIDFVRGSNREAVNIVFSTEQNRFMSTVLDELVNQRTNPVIFRRTGTAPLGGNVITTQNNNLGANINSSTDNFTNFNQGTNSRTKNQTNIVANNTTQIGNFDRINADTNATALENNAPSDARNTPFLAGLQTLSSLGRTNNTFAASINTFNDLSRGIPLQYVDLKNSLALLKNKLNDENLILANFLHILEIIEERLKNAKEKTITSFSERQLRTIISTYQIDSSRLSDYLMPAQIRNSVVSYNKYLNSVSAQESNSQTNFIQTYQMNQTNKNLMFSLLKNEMYVENNLNNTRLKLLVVGIPSGFSSKLSERINGKNINANSFQNKEFDLININVYKRTATYDDIVFKPQKFIFDLSLYSADFSNLSIDLNDRFDASIQKIQLQDFQQLTSPNVISLTQLNQIDKYNFLSTQDKRKLFENHVVSELLKTYICLLTGLQIQEDTFISKNAEALPSQDLEQRFKKLILLYIKEIKNNNNVSNLINNQNIDLQNLINNSAQFGLDKETTDLLKLLSLGNMTFQPEKLKNKILGTKKFDRIFLIPLNIEDFEIDIRLTKSTQSGIVAYKKDSLQNKIIRTTSKTSETTEKLKPRSKEEIVFDDYFINIELMD